MSASLCFITFNNVCCLSGCSLKNDDVKGWPIVYLIAVICRYFITVSMTIYQRLCFKISTNCSYNPHTITVALCYVQTNLLDYEFHMYQKLNIVHILKKNWQLSTFKSREFLSLISLLAPLSHRLVLFLTVLLLTVFHIYCCLSWPELYLEKRFLISM